jgi:alginate O-acetyltransferase complex protein AlgJ
MDAHPMGRARERERIAAPAIRHPVPAGALWTSGWSGIFAALFVALICLPLAANLAGRDGADAEAENRDLAPKPQFEARVRSLPAYAAALSAWFEDHFGFRAMLVRWYGESRLFWLGVSPSATVIKGRDGWLFYGDDGGVEDYTNETPLSPAELDDWRETLSRTHAWLRARGIAYVFTIAPDKHVIYPEHMPPTLRPVRAESRTDQVDAVICARTAVADVDVRAALVVAKAHDRIYFRTDTHWNDRGAYIAYRQIIETIRAQVPRVGPAWSPADFEPAERVTDGMDLARMMGLMRVLHETDLTLRPTRPRRARVIEPRGATPMAEEGRLVTEIQGSSLPRAVVFRDSFASRLVPFLSEHFSRAVYLWQNDFDPDVVESEHPDVVIEEIVGRHLYGFLPSPELVPR